MSIKFPEDSLNKIKRQMRTPHGQSCGTRDNPNASKGKAQMPLRRGGAWLVRG